MPEFELTGAYSLDFQPVSGEVPGGSVSCDEAWRGCECHLGGEMEYTLELETFVDDGHIVQDQVYTCKVCGLPLDLQDYLYAGGNVHTPVGVPVKIDWKTEMHHGMSYTESNFWGEVSA